jgi:hypothetical protein
VALYKLLANPIYVGQVRHHRECHPGQHPAIIEQALWEAASSTTRVCALPGWTITQRAGAPPISPLNDAHELACIGLDDAAAHRELGHMGNVSRADGLRSCDVSISSERPRGRVKAAAPE